MRTGMIQPVGLLATAAWLAVSAGSASACATPVFRYGLENWFPDDYEITVFHRGSGYVAFLGRELAVTIGIKSFQYGLPIEATFASGPCMVLHGGPGRISLFRR